MIRGATPAAAAATILALGVKPCRFKATSEASNSAQAPSLIPEALPAVIVPFGFTTGFNLESACSVVSGRGVHPARKVEGRRSFVGWAQPQFPVSICSSEWLRPRAAGF